MNPDIYNKIKDLYNFIKDCYDTKCKDVKKLNSVKHDLYELVKLKLPHKEHQLLLSAWTELNGPKWNIPHNDNNLELTKFRYWAALRPLKRLIDNKLSHGEKKILPKEELLPCNKEEKLKDKYGW